MRSLLQTKTWADFKVENGWKAHQINDIWFLQKSLPLGKNFLYAPEVGWDQIQNIQIINTKIQNNVKNKHTIFTRIEILDENSPEIVDKLKESGFQKSFEEVQPEWRQIIDISVSEEEILRQMKQKGRYNIKVAQKQGVCVQKSENINEFYEIFKQTAQRDGFEIRPRQYFQKLMQDLTKDDLAELWLGKYNEKTIAAIIVTFYDGVASYLYGASSNEHRNLMAPYLLHWRVIKRAKERGCKIYDLLAVAPEEIVRDNETIRQRDKETKGGHKYAGITRFKEQFGGRKIHLVGSWDLVHKPFWYRVFKLAEKYRRK